MNIPDIHDFDSDRAAKEFLAVGFTAVDDVSGQLVDLAKEDMEDSLGFAADSMNITVVEIDTTWGPVFVFRDRSRVTLKTIRAFVLKHRTIRAKGT